MRKKLAGVLVALFTCLMVSVSVSAENFGINYTEETLTGFENDKTYEIQAPGGIKFQTSTTTGTIPIAGDGYDLMGKYVTVIDYAQYRIIKQFNVPARPVAADLTAEDFEISDCSIVGIQAFGGYEFCIDGTNWVKPDAINGIVFENLTPATEYTIKYRLAATSSSFTSEAKEIKLTTLNSIAIDEVNFPDANFREYVKQFDINSDGRLQDSEIAKVISIGCSNLKIADMTGIEYFTELEQLDCTNNEIASLDFRANTKLQAAHCSDNRLTSVNVSGIETLTLLNVSGNNLKSIDVSTNTNLETLHCGYNQLTALELSNNKMLKGLGCQQNQFTSLDISNNLSLTSLYCPDNQLTSLDITANPMLEYLTCNNNQLTSLDVTGEPNLIALACSNNQLTSLDLSENGSLRQLFCSDNQLTSLDVTGNPVLAVLECNNNQLTSLDLSRNKALYMLYCQNNHLTSVDLSNCKNMEEDFAEVYLEGNSYEIEAVNGVFDLSTLPGGFDVNKASEWSGATISGNTLIVAGDQTVTYKYDLGMGKSATFTLAVSNTHSHIWSDAWTTDGTSHWKTCTATYFGAACTEVNDKASHSGGTATCTAQAVCDVCGSSYGELGAHELTYTASKASTSSEDGNTEYWYCKNCNKYFSDAAATKEIKKADTVIAKVVVQTSTAKTAQTGDENDLLLWLALLAIGISVMAGAVVGKRKN